MKFTIKKNYFLEGVTQVARVISPTPVFQILKGIKVELTKEKMTLKASDSLVSVEYEIKVKNDKEQIIEVIEEGESVFPSKNFIDIIRKFPANEIQIESLNKKINIKSENIEFNIQGYEEGEYPEFPEINKENKIILETKLLNSLIKETIFCTASNNQRPILEGVNFKLNKRILDALATDSYRLSKRREILKDIEKEKSFNIIIPKKALQYIQRIIEQKSGFVEIFYENNRILFIFENIKYNVLLINGNYPNTDSIIKKEYENLIEIDSKNFYDAIDRVSLINKDEKNDVIKLNIRNDNMKVHSSSKELGTAEEEVFCESKLNTEEIKINLSAKYLKEAIQAINCEKIKIKCSGPLSSFEMEPADNKKDIIQILLPIRTY